MKPNREEEEFDSDSELLNILDPEVFQAIRESMDLSEADLNEAVDEGSVY